MGNIFHRQSKYSGKGSLTPAAAAAVAPVPPVHAGAVLGLACLSESKYVSCSDDKTMAIYDVVTHKAEKYFKGHSKAVNRVVAHGSHLWSCSRDLSIKMWDSSSTECLQTFEEAHTLNVAGISYSASRNQLASGSRDYHVKTWDVETGLCVHEYTAPRNIVTCLAHDPSGNLLYQGSEDLCVRVWDTRSSDNQPAIHITGYVYFPLSLSVCPTDGGLYLATGCKGFNSVGCTVKVFDIRSPKHSLVSDMSGHAHDVTACQFMDSRRVLSASKDGTIRLWDPLSGGLESARYNSEDDLQYTAIGYSLQRNGFIASAFNGVISEFSVHASSQDSENASIELNYATSPHNP